jgi:hypothetical protein
MLLTQCHKINEMGNDGGGCSRDFDTLRGSGYASENDPHDVDPDAIKDIGIVRTVLDGNTVHEA